MVGVPAGLGLDTGQIIHGGFPGIEGIAVPVEIHAEQCLYIPAVYLADALRIAETAGVGVHQAVQTGNLTQLLCVNFLHAAVILGNAALHLLGALGGEPVFIPDVVHQVVVVVPAQV